jgi:HK97 family phage major capsid protein
MDLTSVQQALNSIETKVLNKMGDYENRFLQLEQRLDSKGWPGGGDSGGESVGDQIIRSEGFKALQRGAKSTGAIHIPNFKTALVQTYGGTVFVQGDRRPVVGGIQRRLTVRDVLVSSPTNSNSVEFPRETSFTNNAGPQYSAGVYEGAAKNESAIAFELATLPVSTLAHWIPVSRQFLEDASALAGYVNSRLLYGLKLKEEDDLLNGSGIQGHLSGLLTNATSMSTADYESTDTKIDTVAHAKTQLAEADLIPDVVILNSTDWDNIVRTKENTTGAYIMANPEFQQRPQLWGMTVVPTASMAQGTFLVMDSIAAGMIFDRADASVEVSREHSDFFVRNMAAILVEERLCLAVFRPSAMLVGSFPFGS